MEVVIRADKRKTSFMSNNITFKLSTKGLEFERDGVRASVQEAMREGFFISASDAPRVAKIFSSLIASGRGGIFAEASSSNTSVESESVESQESAESNEQTPAKPPLPENIASAIRRLNRKFDHEEQALFNEYLAIRAEHFDPENFTPAKEVTAANIKLLRTVAARLAGEAVEAAKDARLGGEWNWHDANGEMLAAAEWLLERAQDGFSGEEAEAFDDILFAR